MQQKNNGKFPENISISAIICIVGLIIITAGIYFACTGQSSSGTKMGRYGRPYGTGTLDGTGIIFCGVIIFGFGFILRDKNKL